MKLRQLESLLQDVEPFEKPKVELEQYPTGAHLAACVLHTAHGLGDVEGRYVLDLGCGGGMLSIAAAFLGAGHVVRCLNVPASFLLTS
jgi:putative methylase